MRVLMITSEWPNPGRPEWVPFLVQQVNYLRNAGIDIDVFSFHGSKNPLNYMRAWLQVQKKRRSLHYDLVHAQFGQSALIALPKFLPLVVTFHGSDLQGDVSVDGSYTLQGKLLKTVGKFVGFIADEVIVVSNSLGKLLRRRKPYHVVPCGLNLSLFQPMDQAVARQNLNLPPHKKLILFGGRPEMPVKRYPLAKQSVELMQDGNVEMIALSDVPHNQMPLYLNACDVLLLTSLHEGSPTIIKEALACNLPIVSTNVGDVGERVRTVEGCIVCEDDQPETIAEGLRKVLTLGHRIDGRRSVLELDEQIMTQKLISVYRAALHGK